MQNANFTSINWNNQSYATVIISGDSIVGLNGEQIGVTMNRHREVEDGLKKCKEKLIELGVIKVPKTQEEILKEQQELVEKQNTVINQLLERLNNEHSTDTKIIEPSTAEHEGEISTSIEQGSDNGKSRNDKQSTTSKTSFAKFKHS